jgi:DNA-directed RNA polymerase specialized sigma subunit
MSNYITKTSQSKVNPTGRTNNPTTELLRPLISYYKEKPRLLIEHLYQVHGYTYKQVADILGVSQQAIFQEYPKGGTK